MRYTNPHFDFDFDSEWVSNETKAGHYCHYHLFIYYYSAAVSYATIKPQNTRTNMKPDKIVHKSIFTCSTSERKLQNW